MQSSPATPRPSVSAAGPVAEGKVRLDSQPVPAQRAAADSHPHASPEPAERKPDRWQAGVYAALSPKRKARAHKVHPPRQRQQAPPAAGSRSPQEQSPLSPAVELSLPTAKSSDSSLDPIPGDDTPVAAAAALPAAAPQPSSLSFSSRFDLQSAAPDEHSDTVPPAASETGAPGRGVMLGYRVLLPASEAEPLLLSLPTSSRPPPLPAPPPLLTPSLPPLPLPPPPLATPSLPPLSPPLPPLPAPILDPNADRREPASAAASAPCVHVPLSPLPRSRFSEQAAARLASPAGLLLDRRKVRSSSGVVAQQPLIPNSTALAAPTAAPLASAVPARGFAARSSSTARAAVQAVVASHRVSVVSAALARAAPVLAALAGRLADRRTAHVLAAEAKVRSTTPRAFGGGNC